MTEKIGTLQNIAFLYCVSKMCKEIITFRDIEFGKHKFHYHKNLVLLQDTYIEKIRVSNMVFSGKRNINILLITNKMILKSNKYD